MPQHPETKFPLLDPKNDYVFKRLFSESPELLVSLINDLRPDLPEITAVEILNPDIEPADLTGKHIILDILARDGDGHQYNIEMQVRRYKTWGQRSLYYLARMLSDQLDAGQDYRKLKTAIGIHLLDFDLFDQTEKQRQQAIWRFEMRDATQPQVLLGSELQLNIIEMKKADRLYPGNDTLSAWITFFEHWQEDALMANVSHPPVQNALNRIRQLSADEKAQRRAFVRERALHDKVTLMREAREEGIAQGLEQGIEQGIKRGIEQGLELGVKQGIDQGIEQGARQVETRMICTMLDSGMPPEAIAEMLKMPLAHILEISQHRE